MSVPSGIKQFAKAGLDALGLLPLARRCLIPFRAVMRAFKAWKRQHYYRLLIKIYSSPFARPAESYAAFEQRETDLRARKVAERFQADRDAVLKVAIALVANPTLSAPDLADRFRELLAARYPQGPDASSGLLLAGTIWSALCALTRTVASADRAAGLADRIAAIAVEPLGSAGESRIAPLAGAEATASFAADRRALIRAILDRVVDPALAPRFFDYDHIDNIVSVVGTRYCGDSGCDFTAVRAVLDALCILAEPQQNGLEWRALPGALRRALGENHGYVPVRGDVSRHVRQVIPDMADEFMTLKAENDVERFLEINREYSRRQAVSQGLWDNRELSLLRGYERDHQLLLRRLVQLIADGELTREDEVLLIGPRHIDEVVFFRKSLGLPRTIGLDLFKYGRDEILAGDMHRMPFESNRFKLVYCAGTLSYAYDVRRVIEEMARVARRPAYLFLVDAAGRKAGPDALGRSDVIGIDTLVGMFHRHAFQVLARDPGRSLAPDMYENEPCLALRLTGAQPVWPLLLGSDSAIAPERPA